MMLRDKKGFTLIELMIVVAIIGILAAIAIPNFLKFQCRSRQSEARTNLGGIFTAEESFFATCQFYTTDLVTLSWAPTGTPRYVYGFITDDPNPAAIDCADRGCLAAGGGVGCVAGQNSTDIAAVVNASAGKYVTTRMVDDAGTVLVTGDLPAGTTASVNPSAFIAGATGDLDGDGQGVIFLDGATVNELRQISPAEPSRDPAPGGNDC